MEAQTFELFFYLQKCDRSHDGHQGKIFLSFWQGKRKRNHSEVCQSTVLPHQAVLQGDGLARACLAQGGETQPSALFTPTLRGHGA